MSSKLKWLGVSFALILGVGIGWLLLRFFRQKESPSSPLTLTTKKEETKVLLPTTTPHNTPTPGSPRLENPTDEYKKELLENQRAQGVVTISIKDNSFSPSRVYLKKGGIVTWVNQDDLDHQIVGDSGMWGSRKVLSENSRFSQQFDVPGTYPYHCALHPKIKGEVVVKE
jgi:plastocyanin